ncbi:MAG: hypothetical protein CMJ75_09795 [Planctomycetaceae bacterium]|nr:hypothetical protein [Planctomycetaceae bacterium]
MPIAGLLRDLKGGLFYQQTTQEQSQQRFNASNDIVWPVSIRHIAAAKPGNLSAKIDQSDRFRASAGTFVLYVYAGQ